MKPAPPAEGTDTGPHIHDGSGAKADHRPPGETPEPESKVDGSVPDKQIRRWESEGGSLGPAN